MSSGHFEPPPGSHRVNMIMQGELKCKNKIIDNSQIEKEDKEDGFVEVEVTDEMMEDIGINEEFKQEVVNGKKRIIGKL